MVGIGIVGIGFMGMIHYLAARGLTGGQVVALCSRDPRKLAGDWTGIQGNFGPRGTQMDLSAQARYRDVAEILADPRVDLVDLCVPNDEHAALAVRALEAGKHVLVEKPIAMTTADADAMTAAARASKKLLLVGQVLPFFPEFAFAAEAIASGRHGALKAAHLKRVIARPEWSRGIADADRSGGPAIDLHIHDTHFLGLVCGVPRAVQSRGVISGNAVVHLATQYLYDDPDLTVSAVSGALSQAGRPFTHGFEFYLERATLAFESATLSGQAHVATPLFVILPDGTVERPTLGSGDPIDAFTAELTEAVEAVASGNPAPRLAGELARKALRICHAEVESVKTRSPVAIG
jgi:predicted dehydrogenase